MHTTAVCSDYIEVQLSLISIECGGLSLVRALFFNYRYSLLGSPGCGYTSAISETFLYIKLANLFSLSLVLSLSLMAPSTWAEQASDHTWCNSSRQIAKQRSDFAAFTEACNAYLGDIIIEDRDVTEFSRLSQIKYIEGNLFIRRAVRSDGLRTFSNLSEVSGNLVIESMADLTEIAGLAHLSSVGNRLAIVNNPVLQNLDGLRELTSVIALDIRGNRLLKSIEGLTELDSAQKILIAYNDQLENLDGLEGLRELQSFLEIVENRSLRNIDALSNINRLNSYLYISKNPSLQNIQGLASLKTTGDLVIEANSVLTSLGGLSRLSQINGLLRIERNDALTSLDGLELLKGVSEYIYIGNNSRLSNINALRNLSRVGDDFTIAFNQNLPICNIRKVVRTSNALSLEYESDSLEIEIGGSQKVFDNKSECGQF
jgi:hypothetical protein